MKTHQDHSVRRLPRPADDGLSDGGNARGSFGLFRDWQRTQTQSSVRTLRSLRQQIDVRFCGEQEPPAERQHWRNVEFSSDVISPESSSTRAQTKGTTTRLLLVIPYPFFQQ